MYLEKPVVVPPETNPPPGEPPRVELTKVMCPLAIYRLEKARTLLEEARQLLQQAVEAGKDVSEIEPMIVEAEVLLEKADKYCSANNCIPGNYAAIIAITMLEQAIEMLKGL